MRPEKITRIKLVYVRGRRSDKLMFDNSWELLEHLIVELSTGETIAIPKGFQTDLSSIPEILWGGLKPFGDFIIAPIVHDWMYRTKYKAEKLGESKARKFADDEMLWISNQTNNSKWHNKLDNWIRHKAVRAFGWISYKKVLSLQNKKEVELDQDENR
jgi:hypothetical protein